MFLIDMLYVITLKYFLIVGQCDPYVKIKFLPEKTFHSSNKAKTRVIKETMFPLFEEDFEL